MNDRGKVVAYAASIFGGYMVSERKAIVSAAFSDAGAKCEIEPLVRQSDYLALREELAEANESLARLTGMKFSDRMLAALVSRAQSAEAELAALKESAARIERECREAWRQAAHWKSMAAKVGTRINA